jgi:hypothetical protein
MAERLRCGSCQGELREKCDKTYERFLFAQRSILKMTDEVADEVAPGVDLSTPKLDAMQEFTELSGNAAHRYVASIGCELSKEDFDKNLVQIVVDEA